MNHLSLRYIDIIHSPVDIHKRRDRSKKYNGTSYEKVTNTTGWPKIQINESKFTSHIPHNNQHYFYNFYRRLNINKTQLYERNYQLRKLKRKNKYNEKNVLDYFVYKLCRFPVFDLWILFAYKFRHELLHHNQLMMLYL